jgi:hypothetical protein
MVKLSGVAFVKLYKFTPNSSSSRKIWAESLENNLGVYELWQDDTVVQIYELTTDVSITKMCRNACMAAVGST